MPLTAEAEQLVREGALRPSRGSLRLFESRWTDGFWASRPWLPFLLGGLLTGWLIERAPALTWAPLVAGVGGWVVLEYLMHRFFFHLPLRGRVAAGFRLLVHEHHHARPWDERRLAATWWQAGLALALLTAFARAAFQERWAVAMLGSTWAYVAYEAIHHRIHHDTEGGRLMRALRSHHLRHHHGPEGAKGSFGISSPVLDWVLRS